MQKIGANIKHRNDDRPAKSRIGLRGRMLLSFSLLFIAALTGSKLIEFYGIPFTNIRGQIQKQRSEAFRNLSLVADIEKEYLLSWIRDRLGDAHIIAENDLFKLNFFQLHTALKPFLNTSKNDVLVDKFSSQQNYKCIQDTLKTMRSERGVYEDLSIADVATGIILVSSNDSNVGVNISGKDFFTKPLVQGGHYISDIKIDTQSKKPVFHISHVVKGKGSEIPAEYKNRDIAVLVLQIDADRVISPMLGARKGLGNTGEALLFNKDTKIITSLKHSLADGSIAKPLETRINSKPAALASSGQEGIIEANDYRGVPVLAAFRYIRISSDLGWGMVVKRDQAEVFSSLNKSKYNSVLTALISIAVLSILVGIIANNLSRPIRALSAAAQSVTTGDLDARVAVKSSDETGMLASSFNSMVDQLQNWHIELGKKVSQRTMQLKANEQQLRAANQQLTANEQQLRAANQQLKASNQQLEAANQQLWANEEDREKLLKTLAAKNQELQSVVYIASHDLKSPLVNIKGFSESLDRNCKELVDILKDLDISDQVMQRIRPLTQEEIPESLKFISASASMMSKLLDGLLQVSRVGTVEIDIVPLDMDRIIKKVCQAMEFQFKDGDVQVTIDDLPDCLSDKNMINQLFSNLVANALKYLDPNRKGKIHISGTVDDSQSIYCVQDNGIGIDPAHQDKVFEIFHRLDPADPVGGEGLGLTIVTRILGRNNGTIRIESEPGKGSKFFVALPKA